MSHQHPIITMNMCSACVVHTMLVTGRESTMNIRRYMHSLLQEQWIEMNQIALLRNTCTTYEDMTDRYGSRLCYGTHN